MVVPMAMDAEVNGVNGFAAADSLSESKVELWDCVSSCLTQAQFRLVELRYKRGLSLAECANVMGIPKGTVKSRINAVMKKLKRIKIIRTF